MLLAAFFGFSEQSKENPNVWIVIVCIVIFMLGMMNLMSKVPSRSQEEDNREEND